MAVNHSQQSRLIFVVKLLVATLNIGEGMTEFLQGRLTINDRKESMEGGKEGDGNSPSRLTVTLLKI